MLLAYILLLLASFYLLAKICEEYFVSSLDHISKKLGMSSEAAGATFMAVGSSAPELFVSLIALLKPGDHGAIGAGTIVGSAIFNILVIIGGSLMVRKAFIMWQPVIRDMTFYTASIILLLFTFRDGTIQLYEAFIFLGVYALYILAVIKWRKLLKYEEKILEEVPQAMKAEEKKWRKFTYPLDVLVEKTFPSLHHHGWVFTLSIVWIIFLSWVLVESAVGIAEIVGIPEVIIGLTILAAGTSIPDLMSSLIVAKQGRSDMAVSNAVGSNIFDILFGLGAPWLLYMLLYQKNISVDTANLTSSIILLFATVISISFLFVVKRWNLGRYSGLLLIGAYLAYLVWLCLPLI